MFWSGGCWQTPTWTSNAVTGFTIQFRFQCGS